MLFVCDKQKLQGEVKLFAISAHHMSEVLINGHVTFCALGRVLNEWEFTPSHS